jgi:peptidoglycan hydrolase-like protein with peptidoglycan-binding domain
MIRRNNILFICLISLLFFAGRGFFMEKYFVFAENSDKNFFFKKNLKIGDNDEDVRFLQKILNKNPNTQVALFGPGSTGNETSFFGQLTKNAVIKFQEMYASDVLQPFGLKSGTGFVGTATRLKLNSLSADETENHVVVNSSSLSQSSSKSSQSSRNSSKNASSERKKAVVVKSSRVRSR